MKQMSGFELARRILATRPEMPDILSTGFVDGADQEKAVDMGIRHVFGKPIRVARLTSIIRTTLDFDNSSAS